MDLANKYNLKVIDDCARSLLSTYKNRLVGTSADISVFSFESKKHLSAGGEGGMIVSNDEILATNARKFAGIGYKHMTADAGRTHLAVSTVQDPMYKRFDTIGWIMPQSAPQRCALELPAGKGPIVHLT